LLISSRYKNKYEKITPPVEHLNTMDENDPRLIQHIKDNLFVTPAPKTAPYAFSDKRADFSEGQVAHIRNIFKNMVNIMQRF